MAARFHNLDPPSGDNDRDGSNCCARYDPLRRQSNGPPDPFLMPRVARAREAPGRYAAPHNTTGSRYVPNTSLSAAQISPNVAFAFTASIKYGIRFS